MEHQDKIFEQFKKAADTSEIQNFPGMEKVWSRVDAKLDTEVFKSQKKTNTNWKKFAIAASVVVGSVFAFQLWKQFDTTKEPIQNSVVETTKEEIKSLISSDSTDIVVNDEPRIDNKTNEKILHQQIQSVNQVAVSENKPKANDSIQVRSMAAPIMEEDKGYLNNSINHETVGVKSSRVDESDYKAKEEPAQSITLGKKAPPLVVVDGKATDKKVSDIKNSDDLETIVELKEPLYIINGKEYSEKELFGPNPTSPYYPLNKQEIESMSIYQDEEAIELYGDKGKKGVVVIKTKYGRPAIQKK